MKTLCIKSQMKNTIHGEKRGKYLKILKFTIKSIQKVIQMTKLLINLLQFNDCDKLFCITASIYLTTIRKSKQNSFIIFKYIWFGKQYFYYNQTIFLDVPD